MANGANGSLIGAGVGGILGGIFGGGVGAVPGAAAGGGIGSALSGLFGKKKPPPPLPWWKRYEGLFIVGGIAVFASVIVLAVKVKPHG